MNFQKQTPLSDEKLSELLQDLPRYQASPDFLARTMRANQKQDKRFFFPFLTFAATTTAVLVALMMFYPKNTPQQVATEMTRPQVTQPVGYQAELAELKEMNQELIRLQKLTGAKPQLIRVQNNKQQEYYIDVRSFAELTSKKTYGHFRPTRHF